MAPAAIVSAASYTSPVFNLAISAFVFANVPNTRGLCGALVILIAGVLLPFLQASRNRIDRKEVPMEATEK